MNVLQDELGILLTSEAYWATDHSWLMPLRAVMRTVVWRLA